MNDSLISNPGKSNQLTYQNTSEMMMLKRLNYLRNALENYNSKETTAHLRDHADKKKEERLMELWRNELEKPTVEQMVHKMKYDQEQQNMQSSKFIAMLNSINESD